MRLAMISKTLWLAGACALMALGQDSRLSGPVPGFVFHLPTRSIRPIIGVPGSAYLGPMVAQDLDAASVSPLGKSALATRGSKLYFLQGLDSGEPVATPIDGAISAVDRFAWSQDGLSAAVYSADSRQAQILRSPDAAQPPGVESSLDLSSTAAAVSALLFDGKRLLLGAGSVYSADNSGLKLLLQAASPSALALGAGNRDLFVADRATNQIWMIGDYAGDATPMLFSDGAGLSAPAGLRLAGNGRYLLVANFGSRSVDAMEISTRSSMKHIDLEFAPSRMDTVGSGALALLNSGADGEPLYLIDSGLIGSGNDLAVYFVPARSEE
jgi:hypothetical protein